MYLLKNEIGRSFNISNKYSRDTINFKLLKTTGTIGIICLLLAGCSGVKSSFNNFRAYYNTYYNAKKSFNAGVKKVHDQPVQLNPDQFVRIHPAPVLAGREQFEKAVENAIQILQRFPESKWTDNALLLIGKSYYYQQKFFPAIQKFESILALPQESDLKQQTVFWKGRTLLDVSSYSEGISFLQRQLSVSTDSTSPGSAELQVLLAEHMAMAGNLPAAADTLLSVIPQLESSELQGRSYFLLGQLFFRSGQFNKAYQSFMNVGAGNLDYEYIFWAQIKGARAARLAGNTAIAASIYDEMLNDDKNYERRNQIYYQTARMMAENGNFQEAESKYKQILSAISGTTSAKLRANTYFQLSQLYSLHFQNYEMATAYFDSSQAVTANLPEDGLEMTTEMFGQYISLKAQISHVDSLLWLSSLSPAAFDSVIARIRQQKRKQLPRNQPVNEQADNRLVNVNVEENQSFNENDYSSQFGFLNYQNSQRSAAGIRQFRAVWGPRPLVDNWRRIEAASTVTISGENLQPENEPPSAIVRRNLTNEALAINLNEIPFTTAEKASKQAQKASLQYRLGSLFFLMLNEADSAVIYYQKVIQQNYNPELVPKALYALYQLYTLQEQPEQAAYYRSAIFEEYPGSVYAGRITKRIKTTAVESSEPDSANALRNQIQELLAKPDTAGSYKLRADRFKTLAIIHPESSLAPYLFYQSIRFFIKAAKDSSRTARDSLQQENLKDEESYTQLVYTGPAWNRVRKLLDVFQKRFPQAPQINQIKTWQKLLNAKPGLLTCEETGIRPEVKGGMQTFIAGIEFPPKLKKLNIEGTLNYQLIINEQGEVESAVLQSAPTRLGIEEIYKKAIIDKLQFEPILYKGKPVKASCEIQFPINV